MGLRLSNETAACHEALRSKTSMEQEKNKAVHHVKTMADKATDMKKKLGEAIKMVDTRREDYLSVQHRLEDLRSDLASKEGKDHSSAKQIEELQMELLEAQNNWKRYEGDAKTYMEIVQSRQTSIDELTVNIRKLELSLTAAKPHESDAMINEKLSKL